MRRKFTRFFILTVIWAYTVFKSIMFSPEHWILAQVFTVVLISVMFGWMFIYNANPDLLDNIWYRAFAWIGSLLMGLWGTFLLLSLPVDLGFLINYLFHIIADGSSYNFAKTAHLYYKVNFAVLFISIIFIALGYLEVLRGPKVREISLVIPNLPAALQNLRIAQISDLHVGPTIRKAYVEDVVKRTNASNPDLIFITGDIADATASTIAPHMQPLAGLRARLGSYYVTGNHEYYWDAEGLIKLVSSYGSIPLNNENRIVTVDDAKILIAGITDPVGSHYMRGHTPDLKKAIQSSEDTDLKILLAHRPDFYIEAEKLGFDLQFSGHTHAGQFFPFNLLIPLAHKYYRNLHQHGRLWLHVNPGTGYWGPANRFGIPSEITLLKLVKA